MCLTHLRLTETKKAPFNSQPAPESTIHTADGRRPHIVTGHDIHYCWNGFDPKLSLGDISWTR